MYLLYFYFIVESDKGTGARRKTRVCDLDIKDQFWMSQKGSPFPLVAEKIEEELEDYRSKEDDIKRMKSDMGLEGHGTENDAALGLLSDNTQVYLWKKYLMWCMGFFNKKSSKHSFFAFSENLFL